MTAFTVLRTSTIPSTHRKVHSLQSLGFLLFHGFVKIEPAHFSATVVIPLCPNVNTGNYTDCPYDITVQFIAARLHVSVQYTPIIRLSDTPLFIQIKHLGMINVLSKINK